MRRRRLAAFAIDWCWMLLWVAVVAAAGIPLHRSGVIDPAGPVAQNALGLTVIVPVVAAAAWLESRPGGATPGKRALRLTVRHGETRPGFARAAVRNAVKIGLPWALGHLAVFALVDTSQADLTPAAVWWLLAAAYVLPAAWLASLWTPGGRTIHDRVSATRVQFRGAVRLH